MTHAHSVGGAPPRARAISREWVASTGFSTHRQLALSAPASLNLLPIRRIDHDKLLLRLDHRGHPVGWPLEVLGLAEPYRFADGSRLLV
ncbi:MAG TPA: hypothetical protein VNY29_09970 [Terriglobales bacterium]|nr:hypothetical protein [Terriglobales bacterium]